MSYPRLEEIDLLHANMCRALADPKRIQILYVLDDKPRHVTALAEELEIPQPTVSRHLRILRQQSLVLTERDGPSVIYRLADQRIIALLDGMQQVMADALARNNELLGFQQSAIAYK